MADRGGHAPWRHHRYPRLPPVTRVKRALAGVTILGVLLSLQLTHIQLAYTCGPTASSARTTTTPASGPRPSPSPCPTPSPTPSVYDQLRARLGGDLARAPPAQEKLSGALHQGPPSHPALPT